MFILFIIMFILFIIMFILFILITFWSHLLFITKQTHGNLTLMTTSPMRLYSNELHGRALKNKRIVQFLNSFSSGMRLVRRREETWIRTLLAWAPFVQPFEPKFYGNSVDWLLNLLWCLNLKKRHSQDDNTRSF